MNNFGSKNKLLEHWVNIVKEIRFMSYLSEWLNIAKYRKPSLSIEYHFLNPTDQKYLVRCKFQGMHF